MAIVFGAKVLKVHSSWVLMIVVGPALFMMKVTER